MTRMAATPPSPWRHAAEAVLERLDVTLGEVRDGFPFYADPDTGRWVVSSDGNWTGGFWIGLLWLAARLSGETRYRAAAHRWADRLRTRLEADTVFRGFLYYYGGALGALLDGDPVGREMGLAGARHLAASFNPAAGVLPLGAESEGGFRAGTSATNVDSVIAAALLWWAAHESGDGALSDIGTRHALRHVAWCLREDGSVIQSVAFDPTTGERNATFTHKGYSDTSRWARAHAWAMLGFALAARWVPHEPAFLSAAQRTSQWWLAHLPADGVVFWDFDDPAIPQSPRDTSATAIAAAALLKLSPLIHGPQQNRYRCAAEAMLRALVEGYLTPLGPGERRPRGMLLGGCYNRRRSLAPAHELIFGTYYLFESLCVLEGVIPPDVL